MSDESDRSFDGLSIQYFYALLGARASVYQRTIRDSWIPVPWRIFEHLDSPIFGQEQLNQGLMDGLPRAFRPGCWISYWIALSGLGILSFIFAQAYPCSFAATVPLEARS